MVDDGILASSTNDGFPSFRYPCTRQMTITSRPFCTASRSGLKLVALGIGWYSRQTRGVNCPRGGHHPRACRRLTGQSTAANLVLMEGAARSQLEQPNSKIRASSAATRRPWTTPRAPSRTTRRPDSTVSPFLFAALLRRSSLPLKRPPKASPFPADPETSESRPVLRRPAASLLLAQRTSLAVVPSLGYTHSDVPQSYDGSHSADQRRALRRE
jgi:hypothetical protein